MAKDGLSPFEVLIDCIIIKSLYTVLNNSKGYCGVDKYQGHKDSEVYFSLFLINQI